MDVRRSTATGTRRRSWRTKALIWAIAGTAGYAGLLGFFVLLWDGCGLLFALQTGLVLALLGVVLGFPAWLLLWAVALGCGSLALTLVPKGRARLRRVCFIAAIGSGCGAFAFLSIALFWGAVPADLSPMGPILPALATFLLGLLAAWTYYPGRRLIS